eukprot:GGOE01047497.1.p1 GENE.GGOE01047497.1~~GGOE01047497.1.p1  ORF type:complete len:362 (-),score=98.01 GGOE01047497.1:744-1799(-)
MEELISEELHLAVIAPEGVDATQCVTGIVVMDQHQKDIKTLRAQLRRLTLMETADRRHLRISHHITDGTWASVYHVCEEDSGRFSALKVIPVEGANVDSAYANIELLKRLSHPNVVQYHTHFTESINDVSCLCIQLELCSRGTLGDYLHTKALQKPVISTARVREFTSQLASALAYIHEEGCLHGNLCPESVLLTMEKRLKLTGFGSPLCLERRGLAPRTITGGCRTYAPPEWMDSESPHRALQALEMPLPSYDMWSLGCVLSELVTLKLLRQDRRYLRSALAADPIGLQGIAQEVAVAHHGLFALLFDRLLETDSDARITAPEALEALHSLSPRRHSPLSWLARLGPSSR